MKYLNILTSPPNKTMVISGDIIMNLLEIVGSASIVLVVVFAAGYAGFAVLGKVNDLDNKVNNMI